MKRNKLYVFSLLAFVSLGLFSCKKAESYDPFASGSSLDLSDASIKNLKKYPSIGVAAKSSSEKTKNELKSASKSNGQNNKQSFDNSTHLSESFKSDTAFTLVGVLDDKTEALQLGYASTSEELPTIKLEDLPISNFCDFGSFALFSFNKFVSWKNDSDGNRVLGYFPPSEEELANYEYTCDIDVLSSKNGRIFRASERTTSSYDFLLSYSSGKIYCVNNHYDVDVLSIMNGYAAAEIDDGIVVLGGTNGESAIIREIDNQIKVQKLAMMDDIRPCQLDNSSEYCIDLNGNILRQNGTIYSFKEAKVINPNNLFDAEVELKYDGYYGLIYTTIDDDYYVYSSNNVFEKMDGKVGWKNREIFVDKCLEDSTYLDGKIGLPGLGFGLIDSPDRSPIEYLKMAKFYEDSNYIYFNDSSSYLWLIDKGNSDEYSYSLECVNLEEKMETSFSRYSVNGVFTDRNGYVYIYDSERGILKYDISNDSFSRMLSEYVIKEVKQEGINGKIRIRGIDDNLNSFDGYLSSEGIVYDTVDKRGEYNVYTINPIN